MTQKKDDKGGGGKNVEVITASAFSQSSFVCRLITQKYGSKDNMDSVMRLEARGLTLTRDEIKFFVPHHIYRYELK